MITVRDYAAKKGCTVQNVYKLMRKYKDILEGHVSKIGSKTFLDEYATIFLDSYITPKALLATDGEMMAEINKLRGLLSESDHRASELAIQNAEYAKKLENFNSERLLLENDINTLSKEKTSLEIALNDAEETIQARDNEVGALKTEKTELEKELEFMKNRTFWERLTNKKYFKN